MARGFGGAVLFSLPLFMTMELWWLGFYAGRLRLLLFLALAIPLLVGLSHYAGLRPTTGWIGDAADAMSAFGLGFIAAAAVLFIFGVVMLSESFREITGKVALEAVPASFGAVLATSQLGGTSRAKQRRQQDVGYWGQLFFMASGAVYLALSVAPTQEMPLIAFKMSPARLLVLAFVSLALLHAFVYALDFQGQEPTPEDTPFWSLFFRFTVVGYAIALVLAAYILWTFGRFDGSGLAWAVNETVVLGFPATVGAAAARLVL